LSVTLQLSLYYQFNISYIHVDDNKYLYAYPGDLCSYKKWSLDLLWSSDVIGHVIIGLAIYGFL